MLIIAQTVQESHSVVTPYLLALLPKHLHRLHYTCLCVWRLRVRPHSHHLALAKSTTFSIDITSRLHAFPVLPYQFYLTTMNAIDDNNHRELNVVCPSGLTCSLAIASQLSPQVSVYGQTRFPCAFSNLWDCGLSLSWSFPFCTPEGWHH